MVTMAIMVILMAIITMIMDITIVTGIIVIMVQGMQFMSLVMKQKGGGTISNSLRLSPCSVDIPTPIIPA